MNPLISVVIPVFNRGWQLRRALDSLKNQTFSRFEVIVCDDGSTDDSVAIAREFEADLNLRIVQMPNSGGPALPRNRGVEMAKGEWIAYLDSDDWWDPSRLGELLPFLRSEYDFIYHPLRVIKDPGIAISRESRIQIGDDFLVKPLEHMATMGNPIATSGVVVRKSMLLKVGGMDPQMIIEDFDCWMCLAELGAHFFFVNRCLGNYWIGEDAISAVSEKQIEGQKKLFEKHYPLFHPTYRLEAKARQNYVLGMMHMRLENGLEKSLDYLKLAYPLPTAKMALKRYMLLIWLRIKILKSHALSSLP